MRIPVALLGLALLTACGEEYVPIARPNVVLVVVDTLRGDAVHDPEGRFDTPNLDLLMEEGVPFEHAFAHAPMTLPSHTALFSSRPPLETTVLNNGEKVPEDLPLLAEWLREYGYQTRAVTSLGTLWAPRETAGLWRGFDDYDLRYWQMAKADQATGRMKESLAARDPERPLFFFAHYSDPHEPYNSHGAEQHEAEVFLDGERIDTVTTSQMTHWQRSLELEPGVHTFEVRSPELFRIRQFQMRHAKGAQKWQSLDWKRGNRMKPTRKAVLEVTIEEERPVQVPFRFWINDKIDDDTIRRRYVEEVAYVDRWIGELFDELKAQGLYDDALILFTADHGEALGENGKVGHVNGLEDPHIHVPLIIKTPKGDPRRKVLEKRKGDVVPHVNLTPTILEMAGLPPLPGQVGMSLLHSEEAIHFAETHSPEAKQTMLCLRDSEYKMIYLTEDERFVLYDLERDPNETLDVFEKQAHERPDWADRLKTLADLAESRRRDGFVPDAATRENLEALGYGGG